MHVWQCLNDSPNGAVTARTHAEMRGPILLPQAITVFSVLLRRGVLLRLVG